MSKEYLMNGPSSFDALSGKAEKAKALAEPYPSLTKKDAKSKMKKGAKAKDESLKRGGGGKKKISGGAKSPVFVVNGKAMGRMDHIVINHSTATTADKKSMKPGGGGRFAKLAKSLKAKGKSAGAAKAITASIGNPVKGKQVSVKGGNLAGRGGGKPLKASLPQPVNPIYH